ncbi:MAG: type I restriction enzyme HsdR N-terminal domain-containing protein [Chloroflexi bacterium]|nr:type I restriction enzyme HsdR N-terminal domain-containing protein [Chloroflexota bacterium]
MAMPAKVSGRLSAGLKKFQPILTSARSRDVNESDTVVIVTDLLQEVFGYDKYSEITSEHMIRGTFCDLAVKLGGTLALLVEVKAIGLELKDQFVKQAVDYAANQGCEWVALTTGAQWRVYRVQFAKPIVSELVVEFDLLQMNPRGDTDLELLWLLAKEGWQKERLGEYAAQRQALSRFAIAAVVLSTPVLDVVRRELRRITPNVRIEQEEIANALRQEVLKREVLEGEKADAARKLVARAAGKALRATRAEDEGEQDPGGSESGGEPSAP